MSEAHRTDEIQGQIVHVYDDIEEADNKLPAWWLLTFYGAIAFALVYWFYYQVYGVGETQRQKYDAAVAAAEAEKSVVSNASLNALAADPTAVAEGSEIFATQCVACHDTKGQGREGLGPNLTDNYWVHGGSPIDIHYTVTHGIAAKGMPPWTPILGEQGVNDVVAYVITLRNTNVPGKGPEGEPWEPGDDEDTPAGTDTGTAADTAAGTGTGTGAAAGTGAGTGTGTGADTAAGTGTGAAAGTGAGTAAGTDTGTAADTAADTGTAAGTGAAAGTETGSGAGSGSEEAAPP